VQKSQDKEGAQTTVTQLSNNQRVDEIARILGGSTITDKTRQNLRGSKNACNCY
jgi:DNA repair protein RecN (Recombination protein N)